MDSIILIGQKNTLAEYMILSGANNRPPMLDKDMTKKYVELYATEKIQADCDLKETNIILQGLPSDIYSLVNHHRVAKDLWEKGESLHQYYLRFTQLINDMNIYKMKMKQFQVNAKFLNSLPPEWINQQTQLVEFPQIDSGLAVHMFKQGDDPIDAINKMMSFLSTVVTSRFPSTNNQLRNSSNLRQQATIHDGRRKRDATWFREKVLLVEAQGNGKVLNKEELEFLADPVIAKGLVTQSVITYNAAYQADDLDAYDLDCNDISTAKAVLMANLSSYRSDVLSEVPIYDNTNNDMLNQSVQEMSCSGYKIFYKQDALILDVLEHLSNHKSDPVVLVKKVNAKPINYAKLNQLSEDFGKPFAPQRELSDEQALHPITDQSASFPVKIKAPREVPKIMPNALTEEEWGFKHTKAIFQNEIIPFLKTLKDIFNVFDKDLLNEVTRVQTVFNQIEVVVQQYHVDKQYIVNIVVNSSVDVNTSMKVNSSVVMNDSVNYVEMCKKCLELEAELIKQHNMVEKDEYNRLLKRFSELEQHYISLEIAMQLNKEIFQKNNTSVNQTEPSFDQLFELNNLKVELQSKDTTIKKLRAHSKRINETSTSESMKKDFDEIETINIELEHRVIRLIAKNEHLKQIIKNDLRKSKGKDIVDNATTIALGMLKPSTSANGSNPSRNTKNDKILRTPSSNEKNKVEVQSRKVKSILNKWKSNSKNVCNEHVKHPFKGAKSLCSVCNECLFDVNHAMCLIDHVNSMNVRDKSASKKSKKRKEWKPTGKEWKPPERTFTLVGNTCPLTRIIATNKVPLRVPIPLEVVSPEHVVTREYSRRPKVPKSIPNSKPKVGKSMTANRM
ncbi:hypothetical protein Tco_0261070, partial [Tanacetum coccineum]